MNCWKCGAPLEILGKISFRETCQVCHAALHCCRNCVYYQPGRPNDCMVPQTDFVADREANNFCEEYKLLGKSPEKQVDPKHVAQKLFGEPSANEIEKDPKKRFSKLFGDDDQI
jgi:hypothetical protein